MKKMTAKIASMVTTCFPIPVVFMSLHSFILYPYGFRLLYL